MSKIVFKNKDLLVINKPAGISSQRDTTDGESVVEEIATYLRETGESDTLFTVHRLDKVVGGLLVIARNKKTAASLSAAVDSEDFSKDYIAVVDGLPIDTKLCDYLVKNPVSSKAEVVSSDKKGAKKALLTLAVISSQQTAKGIKSLVKIKLSTGRYHQIRAQLSSRGNSLVGDKKYGNKDFGTRMPALFAYKLSFFDGKEPLSFSVLPDIKSYPWNIFDIKKYEDLLNDN